MKISWEQSKNKMKIKTSNVPSDERMRWNAIRISWRRRREYDNKMRPSWENGRNSKLIK